MELMFLIDTTFAKLVNGPLVNTVTLDPGFNVCNIDSQISIACGCLSSGWSVSLGAPNFLEFSAVYLNHMSKSYFVLHTRVVYIPENSRNRWCTVEW